MLGWTDIGTFARMGIRLLLLPLVAGLSYELLRFLALLPDNAFVDILRAPGLALQRLTTYPPEIDMAEVAISSFKLVEEMDADESIEPHAFGELTIPELRAVIRRRLEKAAKRKRRKSNGYVLRARRKARRTFVGKPHHHGAVSQGDRRLRGADQG
ncbi:MAG: DUF1385 domain-containing protein [Christensenellales bacterium]